MTQKYLLAQLLESNSGRNIIAEVLDGNPDFDANRTLTHLMANPEFRRIIEKLNRSEIETLAEELVSNTANAEFQGFKSGVDFALILTGHEPIYDVLPETIQKEFWN